MSTTPAITVRDVSKRYRLYHERNNSLKSAFMRGRRARYTEFDALDHVSLEIPEGSTFGLIGENGSGKSTLLKCIARILRPDTGRIDSRGKISALLELGAGFHPELSGRENVFLNGAILGLSRKQLAARFDDIVAFAGIQDFIDSPVKNYSSGMYLRLGFSVAINVEPDILLVDEILAVGDEQFQRKCSEKFVELRRQGKTVVIVSHALGTIRTMCDQVALLEHGHLRAVGPAGDVIDRYLGDVHHADVSDTGELRWGDGPVRVESVELLDAALRPASHPRTGDRVILRIHYSVDQPVSGAVFGLSVYTVDGHLVASPTTRGSEVSSGVLHDPGYVDLVIPRLLLLPGAYNLGVSITDASCTVDYDVREHVLQFEVESGGTSERGGVVSLGGTWVQPTAAPASDGPVSAAPLAPEEGRA